MPLFHTNALTAVIEYFMKQNCRESSVCLQMIEVRLMKQNCRKQMIWSIHISCIHMIYIIYVIIGEPNSRPLPQCGKYSEFSEGRTCFFLNQMLCYINICVYRLLFAPLSSLRTKLVIIVEQENGKHSPVLKSIFMKYLFCDLYESKSCSK